MSKPNIPTNKTSNRRAYRAIEAPLVRAQWRGMRWKRRGLLAIWFDPEMIWKAKPTGQRGRQPSYSAAAIQACLTMKVVFGMELRQTTGFVGSLLRLIGLDWDVPDFSTLSRRQKTLKVNIPYHGSQRALHLLIDSNGIKVVGEGEWNARKHGGPKRRFWRKVHLGIYEQTLEIRAVEVTNSDVGDAPMLPELLSQIPTAEILDTALLRDRTQLDPTALEDLATSIARDGLRLPVEVWALSTPTPPHRFGLISGLRRLTAHRLLAARHPGRFTTIPALLRSPASIPDAMAQMIAENEIRAEVSAWDRGATLAASVQHGLFDTLDQAIAALHPTATRQKRNRLRSLAMVADALEGAFTTPHRLTAAQMERLSAALRGGFTALIQQVLHETTGQSLPHQWSALQPTLAEAFTTPIEAEDDQPLPTANPRTPRPRRLLHLRQGLTIRREPCQNGYILRFTGPEARSGGLIDDVLDMVEREFQRG